MHWKISFNGVAGLYKCNIIQNHAKSYKIMQKFDANMTI